MKVFVASRYLAKSTLDKKVQVYLRKADIPLKKRVLTKAQGIEWVEKDVPTPGENTETNSMRTHMNVRSSLLDDHMRMFNDFMDEHEERIGITREHLLQATYNDIADGDDGNGTPLQWLMRMILALADKAEGVLTINQKLSQETRELKTQRDNIDDTNKKLAKENDKLLLKLKELNERLADQSKSREIYEKEAKALRERLTEKQRERVSKRVADAAERIKDNDKKAHGPVRLYSDDPEWKNWCMVIKACPKCHCAPAAFPERTVGCSQGCSAEDGLESMKPEAWNEWAINYVPEDKADKTTPEDYPDSVEDLYEHTVNHLVEHGTEEVEVPPPDPEVDSLEERVAALDAKVDALVNANQTVVKVLRQVVEQQANGGRTAVQELEHRLDREMEKARKVRKNTFGDLPAGEMSETALLWGVALKRVLEALRQKNEDPEAAWLRIETALGDLI